MNDRDRAEDVAAPRPWSVPAVHGTLAGLQWGGVAGVPVLALHGWLDNAASFVPLASALLSQCGATRVAMVAMDLPGHGQSSHRSLDAGYAFVDWVAPVVAAADALGWDRFALVGHSMGAGIATLLAGALPDRVSHAVMIDGLGPLTAEADECPTRLARSLREGQRGARRRSAVYRDRSEMADRLRSVVARLPLEAAELLVARGSQTVPGGRVTWRSDPRLRGTSAQRFTEAQVLAFLNAMACPTLVLQGAEGMGFDPKMFEGRLRALRHGKHVVLPGGHHLHMEYPDEVASHIATHLGVG